MAERRPLITAGGRTQELPTGDTVAGVPAPVYATRRSGSGAQSLSGLAIDVKFDGSWRLLSDAGDFSLNAAGTELTINRAGDYELTGFVRYDQYAASDRTDVVVELERKIGTGGTWSAVDGDTSNGYSRNASNGQGVVVVPADATLVVDEIIRVRAWIENGSGTIQIPAYGATLRVKKVS